MRATGRGPVARRGSPPPRASRHDLVVRPEAPLIVVIDSSVFLQVDLLRPIVVCALNGFVRVVWSTAIQREIAKVVYREAIVRFIRTLTAEEAGSRARRVRAEFDRIATDLDRQFQVAE